MLRIITFIFVLCTTISCSQNKRIIPELVETFTEPIINDSLTVELSNCKYFDEDIYIINPGYVIYENCNTRKYLYPNLSSFRFPKHNERGFFALDKHGVYFRGNLIKIDTTGFEIIGSNNDYNNPEILWKTKNEVYKNTKPIPVSDVASFKPLECFNGSYFKDKNYVYYFDKKIDGSDGSSVVETCGNFCFDKKQSYLDGKIVTFDTEKVIPINAVIFKTSKYVLTKKFEKLDMDASTIVGLSKSYSIDKNYVYYKTEKSPIKPVHFKYIKVWDQVNSAYVSDGQKVYDRNYDLKNIFDAKTFWMLPHSDFCVDKNGVYKREWNKEKKEIKYVKFPFKYAALVTQKNTFITDDSKYIVYKNQAYDPWGKVLYENLTEKQLVRARENKLFIRKIAARIIPVDKEYDYLLTKKGKNIYWGDTVTIADGESFESLNYVYYKDKNKVYYYDRIRGLISLKGIDAETVKFVNISEFDNVFLADKNYIYYWKTRLLKNKNLELLGVFTGYRMGCSLDETPTSNYYLFKNVDGYWLVLISDKVFIRKLGNSLNENWNMNSGVFEIR